LTIRPAGKQESAAVNVPYGNLRAIPFQSLEPGQALELIPARGFDIGQGPGKSRTIRYRKGTVGLIVDARGRPLALDGDPALRRQRIGHWLSEMTNA
jgi:hypothetical protein